MLAPGNCNFSSNVERSSRPGWVFRRLVCSRGQNQERAAALGNAARHDDTPPGRRIPIRSTVANKCKCNFHAPRIEKNNLYLTRNATSPNPSRTLGSLCARYGGTLKMTSTFSKGINSKPFPRSEEH